MNEKRYRAVLFDLGGTLRIALEDEPYMRHARRKMTERRGHRCRWRTSISW